MSTQLIKPNYLVILPTQHHSFFRNLPPLFVSLLSQLHTMRTFTRVKNKLSHSLRVAKRLYYNKKLYEYKSNAKSTLKLLNDLINKKKSKCKLSSFFKSNEEEISNPTHIAISFQGPKFVNSLSFEIRNATSTASFCCKLKAFLLS